MLAHVGECLLHRPIDGPLRRQPEIRGQLAADLHGHAARGDQVVQVGGGRLRRQPGALRPRRPQQQHHGPQFLQRRRGERPDGGGRLPRRRVGRGDLQCRRLHGDEADLVGHDIVHLPGELVPLPRQHGLRVQLTFVLASGLDLGDPGAKVGGGLHQLPEQDRRGGGRELIHERHRGAVLLAGELTGQRPPDRLGGSEQRPAHDEQPVAPRPRRQREQRDDRCRDDVGDQRRREGQREGRQREPAADQQHGARQHARAVGQGVIARPVQGRVGHGDRHREEVPDPGGDASPHREDAIHEEADPSSSRPARWAASAAWTRLVTLSFAKMALTRSLTVPAPR